MIVEPVASEEARMSGQCRVEPASFAAGGAQLRAAAEQLAAAHRALSSGLAGTGGMAGADTVGRRFSGHYDPAAAAIVALLGQLGPGLSSVARAVEATGENYLTADRASAMPVR